MFIKCNSPGFKRNKNTVKDRKIVESYRGKILDSSAARQQYHWIPED